MRIDNSRYTSYLSNPELYRLVYEKNVSPKVVPFAFGRGIHMHTLAEARNKQLSSADTLVMTAKNLGISEKSRNIGDALFQSFAKRYDGDDRFQLIYEDGKPLVEFEFEVQIPGSPHSIVGRVDELLMYKDEPWVGDIKSANAKSSEDKKKIEFGYSSQPLFYINAMRMLGYPVKGMLYRVVTEHVPPRHWVIETKRTDYQLANALRSIHQVCEMIGTMKKTFGVDQPWPHPYHSYPCNWTTFDGKSGCEYHGLCGRPSADWSEEDLQEFTTRIDHLDVMKEQK